MKRTFPLLAFFFCLGFAPSTHAQNWVLDIDTAFEQAKNNDKLVLVNFSGSDWCGPCIRMKKEVFSSTEFKEFAKDNLVMVNADFPRMKKNKPSKEQQAKNGELAEKFNPKGSFPKTIILNPEGKVLLEWVGYNGSDASQYIDQISGLITGSKSKNLLEFSESRLLMGSRFSITVVSDNEEKAKGQIDLAFSTIQKIESQISSWDEKSQTARINRMAGKEAVRVDKELFDLIVRCKKISDLTQGAFDISFGSIDKGIWKFDGSMEQWPDSQTIQKSIGLINYRNIVLNEKGQSVFLKDSGMRIGFGAIGKGYAAGVASNLLKSEGIESGVVNAGGDLYCWGSMANKKPWTIAIANPDSKNEAISQIEISDMAVVTSGNYEKFIEYNGVRYCHIIDPRTGYPVKQLKSVTIICQDPELADALATSVFVLGPDIGLDLINQMNQVDCIIIDEDERILSSNKIKIN